MPEPRMVPPDEALAMAQEASLPLRARSHADDDEAIRDLAHTAAALGVQRDAVLALHTPTDGVEWCRECRHSAPCPTVRALGVE